MRPTFLRSTLGQRLRGIGPGIDRAANSVIYIRPTDISTAIADHEAKTDPHTGYQLRSEEDVSDGYAGLDADARTTAGVATTDDVIVDDVTKGVVLRDADGHYWRITVSIAGALVTTDLGTTKP